MSTTTLTAEAIDLMEAGLEMDFLVATLIFGLVPWEGVPFAVHAREVMPWQTPKPCRPREHSTDIGVAIQLLSRFDSWKLEKSSIYPGSYSCDVYQYTSTDGFADAPTPAEAICKAALKAALKAVISD
jgi:hypothetical protein